MGTNCTGKSRVMDVASDETGNVEKAFECEDETERVGKEEGRGADYEVDEEEGVEKLG